MYIAVFVVLLGLVLLLAYYLLPQNAFQRSFWSVALSLILLVSVLWFMNCAIAGRTGLRSMTPKLTILILLRGPKLATQFAAAAVSLRCGRRAPDATRWQHPQCLQHRPLPPFSHSKNEETL